MSIWLRVLLGVLVGAHGIGHILFLMPLVSSTNWGQSAQSWLLGEGGLAKIGGIVIWLVAMLGFLAAAFGIFREAAWWQSVAIAFAVISTVGLVLFWNKPATSPAISALVFNLLILISLFIFHWSPVVQPSN